MSVLTLDVALPPGADLVTTDGAIAVANLQAQIDGLEALAAAGLLESERRVSLVELLILRGQLLGRIADYERATALAEQLVCDMPEDGLAWISQARTRATLHRFDAALADLDTAERCGVDGSALQNERAAIFQALGRYDDALALRRRAAERRPGFATLGALAGLQAERGWLCEAERLFGAARQRYQGISPIPLALLDFQRGLMWMHHGDLDTARVWFAAASARVPAYAGALGHLAEVDIAVGDRAAAIARLRRIVAASDDPEYAGLLAGVLHEVGQDGEASAWRARAVAGYDALLRRHPAAFVDHAAEFWLGEGRDTHTALQLARCNLELRQTPRAEALLRRAELASAG